MHNPLHAIREVGRWTVIASAVLAVGLAAGSGCAPRHPQPSIGWAGLVQELTNTMSLARLDAPDTRLISSYDRTGGNEDYNNCLRKGPKGWVVLADLKGPGYVSRFWFTGGDPTHRVRMYFDGERSPRIDTTVGTLCGKMAPFLPPLAEYRNYCFYSFIPLPYERSLRIEMQEGGFKADGWPRLFYQIAYRALPEAHPAATFPASPTAADLSIAEAVRQVWAHAPSLPEGLPPPVEKHVELLPGSTSNIVEVTGPAVIRSVSIEPDFAALPTVAERERVLRDVLVRIHWDGAPAASVLVPLGDLCGSMWRRTRYESMFFGLSNSTLACRFPMPFRSSASITLENQGAVPVRAAVTVASEPLAAWDPRLGYFHAGWYRTSSADIGSPHPILRVQGRGKYVGCILGVVCTERSYWLLEGDETIRKDAESVPAWCGTGMEDYFNGGWYYQNVLAGATHGVPIKAPFRTVQYRVHLMDPSLFTQSLDMVFERGPEQRNQGWMESVAFYYLDKPAAAFARVGTARDRVAPGDPLEQATIMTDVWNYERLDDDGGASEYIDGFMAKYPSFPFAELLRLRQAAYAEKAHGFAAVQPVYDQIAMASTNPAVRQYVEILRWTHASPSNALLGVYCNTRTEVYIDGQSVGTAGNPERMATWLLQLAPGRHVIAMAARFRPYPDWVQLCLRTPNGDIATDPSWKHAMNPAGNWKDAAYDDSAWAPVGGTGVKGPPEEPFVWVYPDPFVDMQSKAVGLRPSLEWPADKNGIVVYRKVFELPVAGH